MKPATLLPKGVEIRTPVFPSINTCVMALSVLYERLHEHLSLAGYLPAVLSHHPIKHRFEGARNYDRYDYWQWAMVAMSTYGPDANVSVPARYSEKMSQEELHAKVNYYAPAVTALTLASPILEGALWSPQGSPGKSVRTHRRSVFAPAMYIHEKPSLRFELKCLEMSQSLEDYQVYLLLWLTLLIDDTLKGRSDANTRIYDFGQVARHGLDAEGMRQRAQAVVDQAATLAPSFGLTSSCLSAFQKRIDTGRLPADEIIEMFEKEKSVPGLLKHLVGLKATQYVR